MHAALHFAENFPRQVHADTPCPHSAANNVAHVNCGGCGITLMCVWQLS